jgi:hypothetical protein
MSFITIEHTAAAWIDKELTKGIKFALSTTTVVYSALNYASTLIEYVIGQTAGTAAQEKATSILTETLGLLAAAKTALYDSQDVTSIGVLLDKVVANLTVILADAHITNTAHVALITKVLKTLDAIVKAVENLSQTTTKAAA